MMAFDAEPQASAPRPPSQRKVDVMSPYGNEINLSAERRVERHCALIASGSDHLHRVPGAIVTKRRLWQRPMAAAWKVLWIACIVAVAGIATSDVAISRSETIDAALASATAPAGSARQVPQDHPKCRAAERNIAAYSRAVGQLDPWRASHRRLAAIYHEAWQAKHDWYQRNCR